MPSFLNDANSPIYHDNTEILDLDPHKQFASREGKVNGEAISIQHHGQASAINEPFYETSNSSIHDSDVSDAAPMTSNGSGTRPTSMSSLPNGKSAIGGTDVHDAVDATPAGRKLPNGMIASLPDRTIPRSHPSNEVNGVAMNGKRGSQSFPDQVSSSSVTSIGQSSVDKPSYLAAEENGPPLETIPSDSEPIDAANPPLSSSLPASNSTPLRSSPHRLSSPPAPQSTSSTSNLATTGHLQLPPPGSTLKQRHTLEVPRVTPASNSKDGTDTAQASGRFSPTVASGTRRASLSLVRRTTRSMQSDAQRDEMGLDEDAQRWAEAYRQKRASKRKRKEEEDDDRVLVGTKVDESHANWVTAYNMLTGIRVSVSRTNAKLDREISDADFDVKQKSTFDIAGNELIPSAKYDFKFKDYAPWVFRHLRSLFRLDPADYLMSLTGKYILSELGSPGKSGSFFYFSRDYKYIIKTIHHAEHKFLRKILKDYYRHVKENPNTLLSQFYGLHRVKLPYGKKIHFVVMNNLFPPHRDIHATFDLKGSTIGRDYKEEELENNPRATLKDLNWLRRQRSLELGLQKKRLFLEQLQRDVVLLKRLQIMDYSLLVGIHDLSRGNEENLRDKTLQVFNPGGEKSNDDEPPSVLLRTPSKLENARKARELRQMIRAERPVPIGQALDKMPNDLEEGQGRPGFVFHQDDGGFRATHEDDSPANEIYYLGVIDCLTHYGMIKKIEHFWKGLTNDRTQISALPPTPYGDRFYNFIEGNTMSAEEAQRERARKQEQEVTQGLEASLKPTRNSQSKSGDIPPMPDHLPPSPPPNPRSPEARRTVEMAEAEAHRTERKGDPESQVPDRILRAAMANQDKRDSLGHEHILPVVQEAGEESRPKTPAKDKSLPPIEAPPPIPPKYAGATNAIGSDTGHRGKANGISMEQPRVSRESLRNKTLPPLPKHQETEDSGVQMVA